MHRHLSSTSPWNYTTDFQCIATTSTQALLFLAPTSGSKLFFGMETVIFSSWGHLSL
jgi:hypothetical protein